MTLYEDLKKRENLLAYVHIWLELTAAVFHKHH